MKTLNNVTRLGMFALMCVGTLWAAEAVGQVNTYPPLPRLTPQPSGPSAQVLELDGVWEFNPAPKARPQDWKPIEVPGQWLQQGFAKTEPEVVYRRRMAVPAGWQGQRIKLRFDAVYAESVVLLNGKKIGEHNVGYTPFECDATAAARMGAADNLLEVRVRSVGSAADGAQRGGGYAGHDPGGIVRSVRAFAVPSVNLASFHVRTELDLVKNQAQLLVDLKIANEGQNASVPESLHLTLMDPSGKPVKLEGILPTIKELASGAAESLTLSFPVNQPLLWNAEHPNLYTATVELGGQSSIRRVGFRNITMSKDGQLLVNSQVVKLAGVCRWDVHYLRGRSLLPGMGREDVRLFKEANINFIRTSHCPPMEEVLDACDELGMYVLDEAPVVWHTPNLSPVEALPREDSMVAGTLDMLERDRSHPSIVAWSISNESFWMPIFKKTAAMVKHYDPSRPRCMSGRATSDKEGLDLGILDIPTRHYPSPKLILDTRLMPGAILFTEYAHVGRQNQREKISDPGLLDLYGEEFAVTWDAVLKTNRIGGSIWAGIDEYFQLPDGQVGGWGRWGLLDEFRRPKPEYWHVKKVYSPVHITARTVSPSADGSLHVPVSNRYVFTDLKELKWSCPEGSVEVALPPGTSGEVIIRPRSGDVRRVTVEARHPAGWLVDAFAFDLTSHETAAPSVRPQVFEKRIPKLEETPERWVISAGPVNWTVDRKSGLIVQGQRNQTTIISGGPHLVATVPEGDKTFRVLEPKKILPMQAVISPPVKSTAVRQEGGRVIVERMVEDGTVGGVIRFAIAGDGSLTADYDLTWTAPKAGDQADRVIRELGLAFDLPSAFDQFSWKRIGQWSCYPPDHIGREMGFCRAFPSGKRPAMFSYTPQNPKVPWSQDETPWGCNDFRSTKYNIKEAVVSSPEGAGVKVLSDGRQHVRATVEDEKMIRLFVNDYSGIGMLSKKGRYPFGCGYLNLVTNPDQKGHVSIVLVDNKDARVENGSEPKHCGTE